MTGNAIHSTDLPVPAWGKAHVDRGKNFDEIAAAFAVAFPIGSTLTPEEFDHWAQQHGFLNVPTGAPKQSDAWKAHLQRRHELHTNMNKASTHPRIADRQHPTQSGQHLRPYVVECVVMGRAWEVRAPHQAIGRARLPRKIETLVVRHRRALEYLLQSTDANLLPVAERVVAEALYDDITNLGQTTELLADQLGTKFAKLESRLQHLVKDGIIPPTSGIQALTEGSMGEGSED